jgi:hypothetical protein
MVNSYLIGIRALRTFLAAIILVAATTLVAGGYFESFYASRSAFVQPAVTDAHGQPIRILGVPETMIVPDSRAFVPGSGAYGARLVSARFLRTHGIRLVPLRQAKLALGVARACALFCTWAGAVGWLLLQLPEIRVRHGHGAAGGTIRA